MNKMQCWSLEDVYKGKIEHTIQFLCSIIMIFLALCNIFYSFYKLMCIVERQRKRYFHFKINRDILQVLLIFIDMMIMIIFSIDQCNVTVRYTEQLTRQLMIQFSLFCFFKNFIWRRSMVSISWTSDSSSGATKGVEII